MSIMIIVLAFSLTVFSAIRKNILLSISASVLWFALAMWIFYSSDPIITLSETYGEMIAWVFFMLTFLPLLFYMDIAIKHEAEGKSWTEYGDKPKAVLPSSYDEHRKKIRKRLNGG